MRPTEPAHTEAVRPYQSLGGKPPRTGWQLPAEGRLWLLAVVCFWVVGWYKGINLILLLSYLLAILVVLNAWLVARSLRGVRAERRPIGAVHVDEPIRWQVVARTTHGSPAGGWAIEERVSGLTLGWFVTRWDGAEPLRLTQPVVFSARGIYPCEPMRLRGRYPFGLVQRVVELDGPGEVIVLPRCGRIDRKLLIGYLISATGGEGRRHVSHRATSHEADLHGLRPFRPGDSPRWVHWRTTARREELMVREFELPESPDLVVVLDASEPGDGAAGAARFESAVSLAATVCREWCREPGVRLGLAVAGSAEPIVHGLTCAELAQRALELLARANPAAGVKPDRLSLPSRGGWEGVPLLVVGAGPGVPLADELEAWLGRRVARADAADLPRWYGPPKS